jgi:predicted dehydrogenase
MSCMTKGFGVIGVGTWGETHLMAYTSTPGARLVAMCDRNGDLLQQRQATYKAGFSTADYHELLACDDVAAVSVVTPDFLHREIAVAACEAGKHVLLEKPMATTVQDARAIADAATANGVTVMVDFHNRWNPALYNLKQSIEAGEMGAPQMLSMRLNDTLYVPTGMLAWAGSSSVAWFLASHALDLVRWLFDDEIERVYSVSRSRVLAARGINTPDFFQTICELKGGAVAHVENCWIMSEAMPTVFDFKAEFIGSEGTTFVDCSSHRMVQKYSSSALSPFSTSPGTAYPDVAVVLNVQGKPGGFGVESIRHFVDHVVSGAPAVVSPADGVMNTAALVALHLSAQSGQPVELASVL